MNKVLERLKCLATQIEGRELAPIKLVNLQVFEYLASEPQRLRILRCIARGINTASELSRCVSVSKTGIYRYLKSLVRSGFVTKVGKKYFLTARLYLVYRVEVSDDNTPCIRMVKDMGAIVDSNDVFFIRGPLCECALCNDRARCLDAVRKLARVLDVKIRSTEPLDAFREIVSCVVTRDLPTLLRRACLVIEVPELMLESQA